MRHFLWSGNASSSKTNYVNWVQVTPPKDEGGLGIRKLLEVNDASFIKLGWPASIENFMWSRWFKNYYVKQDSTWSPSNTIYGFCIWKRIHRLVHYIHQGSTWTFENGQDIYIWHDSRSEDRTFSAISPHLQFQMDQRSSSFFHSGTWYIPSNLPLKVQNQLSAATSNLSPNQTDRDNLS